MNISRKLNKLNINGRFIVLVIFGFVSLLKWYVYLEHPGSYGYEVEIWVEIFEIAASLFVLIFLSYWIYVVIDKWAKRYLLMLVLFLVVGGSFRFWRPLFSVVEMQLFGATFYTLLLISLSIFYFIYRKTSFSIYETKHNKSPQSTGSAGD